MKKILHYVRLVVLSCLGAIAIASLYHPGAMAHWADLSVADIVVGEASAQMTLTIPTTLVSFADDNGDAVITDTEFIAHRTELTDLFLSRITFNNENQAAATLVLKSLLADTPERLTATPEDHSTFLLQYQWPDPIQTLDVGYTLFPEDAANSQCLVTISWGDDIQNIVLTPDRPTLSMGSGMSWPQQGFSFLVLGVEHIFTGYDHILFLVALLLPGGKLIDLLKIVTAFTLAHSITLSLAALNIVTLPSALVESIIALSIVYVAFENLFRQQFQHRWGITFGFGLIHGLGFANILRELATSQGNLALSLVSFNIGVELGQLAIVLMIFLGLQFIQKQRWLPRLRGGLSTAMVIMGTIWFLERAFAIALS